MFGFMFMVSHIVSGLMNMDKLSKMAKLIYICIKARFDLKNIFLIKIQAAIFILVESLVMPLLCGCWIDFCSLSLLVRIFQKMGFYQMFLERDKRRPHQLVQLIARRLFGLSLVDWNALYVLLLYFLPLYERSPATWADSRFVRQKLERSGV